MNPNVKISVVIPAYNSAAFIQKTLDAVLQQSLPAFEIIVLDDGSKDDTVAILNSYRPRITIRQQQNKGVAASRNSLCQLAQGELVAFLDHDDIWHPRYLEVQARMYLEHPSAVAFFTGHVDFHGHGGYHWNADGSVELEDVQVIEPMSFLTQYNTKAGLFGSASFFCVPKRVLANIGDEPFDKRVAGVDDSYFCTLLPLLGSVVYCERPLVAYRIIREAQSTDKVKAFGLWVKVFELLEARYRAAAPPPLRRVFQTAFASKRRQCAKRLIGAGRTSEARQQLWRSLGNTFNPASVPFVQNICKV